MPTLETVAARAGVSRQTVSNALHRPDRLAQATRDKVLAGGAAPPATGPPCPRGSSPPAARTPWPSGPTGRRTGSPGWCSTSSSTASPRPVERSGNRVVLYPEQPDEGVELAVMEELLGSGAADAVVLTATNVHDGRPAHLTSAGLTFCAFGRPWGAGRAAPRLGGRRRRPRHRPGRRAPARPGPPADRVPGLAGRRGDRPRPAARLGRGRWTAAAGPGPAVEAACENDSAQAQSCTGGLLDPPRRPGRLRLRERHPGPRRPPGRGRRPVRDVVVVGFDATPVAAALGLASVAQPVREAAHTCLELLLPRLAGASSPARGVLSSRPSPCLPEAQPTTARPAPTRTDPHRPHRPHRRTSTTKE